MKRENVFRKGVVALLIALVTLFAATTVMAAEKQTAPEKNQSSKKSGSPTSTIRLVGGIPDTLPLPGDIRPYADSDYAEQIDKALAFMIFKYRDSGRWFWLVLLDYLQRQYDLPERYSLEYTLSSKVLEEDAETQELFQRFVEPGYMLPLEKIEKEEGYQYYLLRAVYCSDYPVDDAFLNEMTSYITENDDTYLFFFSLAVVLLRENECIGNTRNYMKLRGTLGVTFRNRLEEQGVKNVFSAEALAMLPFLNYREMLQDNWLPEAVSYQNNDGGWPNRFQRSDPHMSQAAPTMFMIWAMLQDVFPEVERTPLMPMPVEKEGDASKN